MTAYEIIDTPFEHAIVLADGSTTGGRFALFDVTVPAGGGSPPHVHRREEEAFYVLEGEVEFYLGAPLGPCRLRATAGDFILGPRDVPHNFTNVGAGPLRMLIWVSPAGFEGMFRALATLPAGPPDLARVTQICANHGIEILPPWEPAPLRASEAPLPAGVCAQRMGGGERLDVMGESVTIKAASADTRAAWALFEVETQPGGGTPPHVHEREDEAFFVLDGEVTVTLNGTTATLRRGDFAYGPVRVPHHYHNAGAEPARTLVWALPGGLEHFFRETTRLATPPDFAAVEALCRKYGMELRPRAK